jgi:hypothetical protein
MKGDPKAQFLDLVRDAVTGGALVKLTLAKPVAKGGTLENVFVRPVSLKSGPRLAFVWHHRTRDITKNHEAEEALGIIEGLIGAQFQDAHLFTTSQTAQLETALAKPRLRLTASGRAPASPRGNDRKKRRPIPIDAPWLKALGVTDDTGRPIPSMADKLRQIERFAKLLGHLIAEAPIRPQAPISMFDMGCGKGYLTFAASELLGDRATVCGVEVRADLVTFCSAKAKELGLSHRLSFRAGTIAGTDVGSADVLVALHACDTATDDALAKGIAAGAALLVVAPCCQKEVRPQIVAPQVLAGALRHGIFMERQAEFVTDALRALLLEWAGYGTKVMEFISTEHTAKNTMIAAVRQRPVGDEATAERIRAFAGFYGVKQQALAMHLGFALQ